MQTTFKIKVLPLPVETLIKHVSFLKKLILVYPIVCTWLINQTRVPYLYSIKFKFYHRYKSIFNSLEKARETREKSPTDLTHYGVYGKTEFFLRMKTEL